MLTHNFLFLQFSVLKIRVKILLPQKNIQYNTMSVIESSIDHAKLLLEKGEVVAIPTETVYGLAANAYSITAIEQLFKIKKRPQYDPLIVHTASIEQVAAFVLSLPDQAKALAKAFWPGPLTMLLPKKSNIPNLVTSGLPNVGVRIPAHPLTLSLLKELPFPLAAPSANPFGYISPTTPQHVEAQLGAKIPFILDGGPSQVGLESTIVGWEKEQPFVYRLGGIPLESIIAVLGPSIKIKQPTDRPQAPGMLTSHYAPHTPVFVHHNLQPLIKKHSHEKVGLLTFSKLYPDIAPQYQVVLSPNGNMEEAAHHFFAGLRKLDQLNCDVILAEFLPAYGLGRSINERLIRAATQ